jgi:uncharacterized membrane protein YfcA
LIVEEGWPLSYAAAAFQVSWPTPSHWRSGRALVAVRLLLGSPPGAWLGASWATRMRAATLHAVLGVQRVADLTRRCTSARF